MSVSSALPLSGWRHDCAAWAPWSMAPAYARHVRPEAVTWSPTDSTVLGYTHPSPWSAPSSPMAALDGKSTYIAHSARVAALGGWPPVMAM